MSTRAKVLTGAGLAIVAVIAALGATLWYVYFRDDAPEEVSLAGALEALASASAAPSATNTTAASDTTAAQTATPSSGGATPTSAAATEGVDGTWVVDNGLDSFVGYRVGEELATIGVTTAVGRTSAVTGDVVIADNVVTSAVMEADLRQLQSDSSLRDGQLRRQGIETDTYPTSTFELTEPISLPGDVSDGAPFQVTLTGNLTLHGVTNAVAIPAEAQLVGENLVVVGSIEIVFADYDIEKPRAGSVVSIEDTGIMEMQLFLSRG